MSIIVPVWNEEGNIANLIKRISEVMRKAKIKYEIIFVDDASTDKTVKEIKKNKGRKPIKILPKKGKQGKSYSIIEGVKKAKYIKIAMIDGDLQYPPEKLPEMLKLSQKHGVVVGNRIYRDVDLKRKILSKLHLLFFERLLHGFKVDTQSGMKVFKKEIISQIKDEDVSPWTLDLSLLKTALDLGESIVGIDIEFTKRNKGSSKINILSASYEIAKNSLILKFKPSKVYKIYDKYAKFPTIFYKGKKFVTYTDLPVDKSAITTFTINQKLFFLTLLVLALIGAVLNLKLLIIVFIAVMTLIYFLDLAFSAAILTTSLGKSPEISIPDKELKAVKNKDLPVYSILCPLYKEASVLPHFVEAIKNLDWPKGKLDVLLLLEEDDTETINTAKKINLPKYIKVLIVPDSKPKTKPKACNYGLFHSKGEYIVIYDAEDKPDPLQLKKAYLAFKKLPKNYVCLQSKLNYYNSKYNFLTRLFTAEYSLWFDLILPGLQTIGTSIPLGGTSNHFRKDNLSKLHGWDPFNVTEDCDLGVRLFKAGYKTAIIDSTTYEEANSNLKNWLRQRSRWIKGYFQTYLVHMRNPVQFFKESGIHTILFQLIIGMRMVFIIINPIFWIATISYFVFYDYVGLQIESLFPPLVFYVAVVCLVFGNFLYFYSYMIGLAKRNEWNLVYHVFFIPFYWMMASVSAVIAFYQLIVKPHYWEKTIHGLHLKKGGPKSPQKKKISIQITQPQPKPRLNLLKQYVMKYSEKGSFLFLFGVTVFFNFANFFYNAYLGRNLDFDEFGTVSLMSNIFGIVGIVFVSLYTAISYKSGYIFGKVKLPIRCFLDNTKKRIVLYSFLITLSWLLINPYLFSYFKTADILPFLSFFPVFTVGFLLAANKGYLSGNIKFYTLGFVLLIEAVTKLIFTVIAIELDNTELIYVAIPASVVVAFILSELVIAKTRFVKTNKLSEKLLRFPTTFFSASLLTNISAVAFLSIDVVMAKHYLPSEEAGIYALLSLSGKIVFYLGTLFSQFFIPLISKREGEGLETISIFNKLLLASTASSLIGFVFIGWFGFYTVPILFGSKAYPILPYLIRFCIGMVAFTVSVGIVTYHLIKNDYSFAILSVGFSLVQVFAISNYHSSFVEIANIASGLAITQLLVVSLLHIVYSKSGSIIGNIEDLFGLFTNFNNTSTKEASSLKILVFNWRDIKHVWAGGAEVYIHNLAKNWVKEGHEVTIFCGSDQKSKRTEKIDGVKIIRRGGFYTVYLWAFLYYTIKFRGKFDIVIDCENGIPFFTPFYSRLPKILVLHHIHQDVHRQLLPFPLNRIAMFLEGKLIPIAYRKSTIITVSESTKKELKRIGLNHRENIHIIPPCVDIKVNGIKKTKYPSFIYLGRLKPYKNIDIAINAFSKIVAKYPEARLTIAGDGESREFIKELIMKNKLNEFVKLTGKVSEKRKINELSKSWVSIQPSTFEGWGITVLEANACATPVVASNVSGLKDSVVDGETGILFPLKNVDSLAQVMEDLIKNNKKRMELSRKAKKWAEGFSWEKNARDFLQIMQSEIRKDSNVVIDGLSLARENLFN